MPAGGGSSEETLSTSGLDSCRPVGTTETVFLAVFSHGVFNNTTPTTQILSLSTGKDVTHNGVWATLFPPLKPFGTKAEDKEIEQTGEADTNDRVYRTAVAITLNSKLMMKKSCSS